MRRLDRTRGLLNAASGPRRARRPPRHRPPGKGKSAGEGEPVDGREGGAGARQRRPDVGGRRRARPRPRSLPFPGGRHRGGRLARRGPGIGRGVRSASPVGPPASGSRGLGEKPEKTPFGQRHPRVASGLRQDPGQLRAALHAAGPRRRPGRLRTCARGPRARDEQRDGQSSRLRPRRPHRLGRQLPRRARRPRPRLRRHRRDGPRLDLRTADREAPEPGALRAAGIPRRGGRRQLGTHDGAGDGGGPRLGVQGARAPGLRGLDPDIRRQGGPRLDVAHRRAKVFERSSGTWSGCWRSSCSSLSRRWSSCVPLATSPPLERVRRAFRRSVAPWKKDRVLSADLEAAHALPGQHRLENSRRQSRSSCQLSVISFTRSGRPCWKLRTEN